MTKDEFAQISAEEIQKMAEESSDEVLTTLLGIRLVARIIQRIYKED